MITNAQSLRNIAAEHGFELTPAQAKKLYYPFMKFRDAIKEACETNPYFYRHVLSLTTEDKLDAIKVYNTDSKTKITLKEYNEIQNLMKLICQLEGYNE